MNVPDTLNKLLRMWPYRYAYLLIVIFGFPVFRSHLLWIICLRTIISRAIRNRIASRMSPVTPRSNPSFIPTKDVSVLIPTICPGGSLEGSLRTWLEAGPLEIIIVTIVLFQDDIIQQVSKALQTLPGCSTNVRVLTTTLPRKRQQLTMAIREAKGTILVLADDDVFWPPRILTFVLACFEDPEVGGVGTRQNGILEAGTPISTWEHVGGQRLVRRNREMSATNCLEPSVTCLSGRTAAYRAHILKSEAFLDSFVTDYWLGRYLLDSGDDTFITRFLLRHGWKIRIQVHPEAEIATLSEPTAIFLRQILRWSRNTKRSYLRCVFLTPGLWRSNPVLLSKMSMALLHPFQSLCESYALVQALRNSQHNLLEFTRILVCYFLARTAAHLLNTNLRDVTAKSVLLGVIIEYSAPYIDLFATVTLHKTDWGTRLINKAP